MLNILQELKDNRQTYYNLLIENIADYIYREKRYSTRFSVVLIYNENSVLADTETLQNNFRETDKLIPINSHLIFAIFDSVNDDSYLKAAENLCKTLQKAHYKERFFSSTANSVEFNTNYLDMTNKLFERLEYAIKNNIFNSVVYQDYII